MFARRKRRLSKLILIRILVILREQPSEELGMQLRGMLVINGDLGGVQGLNQATDEVEDVRLIVGFY